MSLLHFRPLSPRGTDRYFTCDAEGRIDMDAMSEHERTEYLYARALVGFQFAPARIETSKETLQ